VAGTVRFPSAIFVAGTALALLAGNAGIGCSGPPPVSLRADFSRPLGPFGHPPGRALSSTPGRAAFDDTTWQKLSDLELHQVRLWVFFDWVFDPATKQSTFEGNTNAYFLKWSAHGDRLLVNANFAGAHQALVETGQWSEEEYTNAWAAFFVEYKKRFPKIESIEVDNEPTSIGAYYPGYRVAYTVLHAVNARIDAGELPGPRLRIGGPTTYRFWPELIGEFLDRFAADPSPVKQLDFVSYHQYLLRDDPGQPEDVYKGFPSRIASERDRLDAMLAARGLPTGLPVLITEGGLFAGPQPEHPPMEDYFIKAAGQLAIDFFYLGQASMTPFRWTVDIREQNKALFVENDGVSTGVPRPFYTVTLFETWLPETRYPSGSRLDAHGLGVASLAGGSSTRVAMLVWNYQWRGTESHRVIATLDDLPRAFSERPVRVRAYLLRRDHDRGDLPPAVDVLRAPASSYSQEIPLGPNEAAFLELTAEP
jgi:hypothetical protein